MHTLLTGILLAQVALPAQPGVQERARVQIDHQGEAIVIEAHRHSREQADQWVAEGDVVVTYGDTVLKAPRVAYNPLTGEAVADGPLELTRGLQWLKGSRAELNLKTRTGTLFDAEGFTDATLYVKAKQLTKTGPDSYNARNGFVTACEEAIPKWSFKIRNADLTLGGHARFSHTVFRIKKVPVFYLPYMLFPTERKERSSGFTLPSVGNSSNKGRRISESFYLVLGRSADLMIREDYFSKRGFGQGLTFRTRPNAQSSLEVDWYWIDDRKDQGGTSFNGIGETRLPHGFRAVADFNLVSNFTFRQVFSETFLTATEPTERSRVFVTNNFKSRSFNFIVSREETVFPGKNTVVRHLPAIDFRVTGQRIYDTPFYLDFEASAAGLSRDDLRVETPGLTQRLDLFPQLYLSLPLFQGLRATPRLGVRETFYSDSLRPDTASAEEASGNNVNREYLEFTLDLQGWGLSRIYTRPSGGRFKHLVEPTLRYRYITGVDEHDRILRFDLQDAIFNTHEVEYALVNRIFIKRNDQPHEWLSFKIAQKYFLDPDFGGAFREGSVNQFYPLNTLTGFHYGARRRRFSPLTLLARFTPVSRYRFDVRGDYDPDFRTFRNFSVTGSVSRRSLYLGTTYFITRELDAGTFKSNQLQVQAAIGSLQRGLSVSGLFSYDAVAERFLSYRARLNYFWDCCGVSLSYEGFNVGVREEQQVRFSFFLKGIGTFGTIRSPERIF